MGTSLTGTKPKDTYDSLIKVTDNGPLSGTLKTLTDGLGNDSSLSLSTTAASLSGTLAVTGDSTLSQLDLVAAVPALDFALSANTAFKHTIEGTDYSSTTSLNKMTLKVASGASTQVDVMTLNGAGNVGIGTSSPSALLDARLTVNTNSIQQITRFAANNASGELKALDVSYTGSDNLITINTNAVGTDPSIAVKVGVGEVARFSSGGITFNGDTAAANALDDYEEGTYTVTFTPQTSGTITLNASYSSWTYTKIGRQITIRGVAVVSSVASPVGGVTYISLPLTNQSVNGAYTAVKVDYYDSAGSPAFNPKSCYIAPAQAQCILQVDASTITAGHEIYVTATYFV